MYEDFLVLQLYNVAAICCPDEKLFGIDAFSDGIIDRIAS